MKTLLFLNGPEGIQTGIEDGFTFLEKTGKIAELKWFYFDDYAKKYGKNKTIEKIKELSITLKPELIVFFHVGKFPITKEFIFSLKNLPSKPIIVYDEGDMYGTWAKPISKQIKIFAKYSDVFSMRGLGKFYNKISKYNKNIIYTPHHNDIARFDIKPYILEKRDNLISFVGNNSKPKFLSSIRRMPGSRGRESFVKYIGKMFPDLFNLYGNGWNGFIGSQGPVDFQKQIEIYRNTWITLAYEHYPNIPYYFSNRLPMALMSGSLYVCHYHQGYENFFKNCDFIFFFNTNEEAVDIINFLKSLSKDDLLERSKRAREFALRYLTPQVVWSNFYNNVLKISKN
jgi:hypothetical protein